MFFYTLGIPHLSLVNICGKGSSGNIYKLINTKNNKFYIIKEEPATTKDLLPKKLLNIGSHSNIRQYTHIGHSPKPLFNKKACCTENYGYNYYLSPFYKYTLREIIQTRNDLYFNTKLIKCPLLIKESFHDNGTLDRVFILKFFIEIVKGTLFLHKNNKIHRDLKPENIFILNENSNIPVIGDFDLAKDVGRKSESYSIGVGTITYIAPESRTSMYSYKVDVFALGLIYFELLWPMKTGMERIINFERLHQCNVIFDDFKVQYPEEARVIDACIHKSDLNRITASKLLRCLFKML